ncbi:hypothetical protein CQA49_01365 [Helicobacter sp. MIT 00-7814]|nr:hypothetical protein CQA37_07120 [Helicobacter sp. MIT 99-10781]RDU56979.1 hypothetical protein CQA49_01365 [Helicobacter sp. MIT 00-7814]
MWINTTTAIQNNYFECDNTFKPYLSAGGNKTYLDSTQDIWSYFHPTDSGNIIEQSLAYKVICIASLKHVVIMQYMTYLESFAVPPLLIKSDATQTKELAKSVLDCALDLRSNGVGLFGKEDTLEVLNGNVDKGTFLEFVRYCDECISKVITGQVLAGNAVEKGTQALGSVHSDIQKELCEFDAALLSQGISALLQKALELNFANVAPFSFELDTNTEKDEKLQADTYLILSQMGVKIPLEHLEKTFKITGLSYAQEPINAINPLSQSLHSNTQANSALSSFLPLDGFDRNFQTLNNADFGDIDITPFLKGARDYEEVQKALELAFKGQDLLNAEQKLMDLCANAFLFGEQGGQNV